MDLRQSPLRMDEREPSILGIKDKSTSSTPRDSSGRFRKKQWFDEPIDTFGIKMRPTLSGEGDSERHDANAKDVGPIFNSTIINLMSRFSKAVPKELADLLSDLDTLDILSRRDWTEQSDDYGKASLETLDDSP